MASYTVTGEADLEEVLDGHDTVLIDFWAPWCPPCREFVPVFEAVARRHPDLGFCRVNTQESGDLARPFEVASIPTLVIIRDRIMVASRPGYLAEEKLEELLERVGALDMEEIRRAATASGEGGGP